MLHEFIAVHRAEIIRRCRTKAEARSVPSTAERPVDHGVPVFLDQAVNALRLGLSSNDEIGWTAVQHGHDLLLQGFTVAQVVHDYGDVCQAISELAVQTDVRISADEFRVLNGCLDEAIAGAVTEYGRARSVATLERETARESQRLGYFAHELRNLIDTSIVAFEVLKSGNVGVAGSTGAVLQRSLSGLRALVARSLAEVRLTQAVQNVEPLAMAEFVQELAQSAALEANARGIRLAVSPVDGNVAVEADRQVLAAVVGNLLQNACKFTQPGTCVTLRVVASDARVMIEVEDECLGLPTANVEGLFRPFEQRGADRSGLGLGLAFSRWGVEANHGTISARNLPERGCVFTVDLPRIPLPAAALPATRAAHAAQRRSS
jgi:signal transduction histidine kinase